MKRKKSKPKPKISKNVVCEFCEKKIMPSYKEPEILAKFVSERARIAGRSRSGICAKHQRHLSQEIKRARHLALLPFRASF
jgi:small subunit ribosomal protein S18